MCMHFAVPVPFPTGQQTSFEQRTPDVMMLNFRVMESDRYQVVLSYLTTLLSQPQQTPVGCYTPVPKSPDLLARHRRLPTSFRLEALYPSHELPGISRRQPVRWADESNKGSVERAKRHSDAPELGSLEWASVHPALADMSEPLCAEVSHAYQSQ